MRLAAKPTAFLLKMQLKTPNRRRNQSGGWWRCLKRFDLRTARFSMGALLTIVPRFGDNPTIDVVLVDRNDLPSAGAGETPIVGLAPAVDNAIFNATGMRLRSLPLVPSGLPLVKA